jgi:hypothetical protein
MRSVLYLVASLVIVAAIAGVAALWVHLSHTRVVEGRMWLHLWGTHGLHTVDLIILGFELFLITMLVTLLLAGFSRR